MKNKASFRSLRYSGDILGVDLGSHTIKVLQLRVSGHRALVVDYAQAEVRGLLADATTEADRKAVLVTALKGLLKTRKFKATRAAITLPGSVSIVKFMALTPEHKRDRAGVPLDAKALSPFEPDDTGIEIRQPEGKGESLIAIAQKKAVNDSLSIVRKAGLTPAVVLNDALALESAYDFTHGRESKEPVVLVNIGAATTTVAVVENGTLKMARTFNIAGDAFTRALKREFGVEAAEAEALKKEYGLFGHRMAAAGRAAAGVNEAYRIYNDTAMRVAKTLAPAVKDLALGVQRTIDAFLEKRNEIELPVARVVLAGGGADMKSLSDVMSGETGLPVDVLRPLANAFVRQSADLDKNSAALAVPFGLALSSALRRDSTKPRLNLLPSEAKRAAAARNGARVLLMLLLVAGAGVGVRHLVLLGQQRLAEREKQIELELKLAEEAKKKAAAAEAKAKGKKVPAVAGGPKAPESPNAKYGRLKVSGVFGDMVMLTGGRSEYTARAGQLFDDMGKVVPGVSAQIQPASVVLSVQGERFVIAFPK